MREHYSSLEVKTNTLKIGLYKTQEVAPSWLEKTRKYKAVITNPLDRRDLLDF